GLAGRPRQPEIPAGNRPGPRRFRQAEIGLIAAVSIRSWRMTMTKYAGGCACGAIHCETSSKPIVESHCQCSDCQKRSGTGHGSYLVFPLRAEMTITGEAKDWRVAGVSGIEKINAFCQSCRTPVYLTLVSIHY